MGVKWGMFSWNNKRKTVPARSCLTLYFQALKPGAFNTGVTCFNLQRPV